MSKSVARRIALPALAVIAALGMPQPSVAQLNPDLAKASAAAWKAGRIYVPAELSTTGKPCESMPGGPCEKTIKEGKHPVIVFMHGCDGPKNPATFLGHGAIVVAPNSLAGGRHCRYDAQSFGRFILQRRVDALTAANEVKASNWADPDRLILAGFANGARVAALYVRDDFLARIIVAWTCTAPQNGPDHSGIRGKGPALAVLGTADEYLKRHKITGNCNDAVATRGGPSKSLLIEKGGHQILDHAQTRAAVKEFLAEVLK